MPSRAIVMLLILCCIVLVQCSNNKAIQKTYSWSVYYESTLHTCLRNIIYHDHLKVWNDTQHCIRARWYNCLYLNRITVTAYNTSDLCRKMSLKSPLNTRDATIKYAITIKVPSTYTINVTFVRFWMEMTPFGCKRNKMKIFDGSRISEYCGIHDPWSVYSRWNVIRLMFFVFGVASHFQVELFSTILDIVNGIDTYQMHPVQVLDLYRGHPRSVAFSLNQLLSSSDPVQVTF